MKIIKAYKGLDSSMRPTQGDSKAEPFEIGKIYYKDNIENPKLCTNDGFHFCKNLIDVGVYYSFKKSENRYFEIDVLGNYTECRSSKKCITTAFRLVRELPREEVDKYIKNQKEVVEAAYMVKRMRLDTVRDLQRLNPNLIISGSIALFLQGCFLQRWTTGDRCDLDLILPFYQELQGSSSEDIDKALKIDQEYDVEEEDEEKYDDNDFDYTLSVNNIKTDLRIDPLQRYQTVEVLGTKFKVAKIEDILKAKIKYKDSQGGKHRKDIIELTTGKMKEGQVNIEIIRNLPKIQAGVTLDSLLSGEPLSDSDMLPF